VSAFLFASANASSCFLGRLVWPAPAGLGCWRNRGAAAGASVEPTEEGNGGGERERHAAATGAAVAVSAGSGRRRWPARRSGHLGSVGVAVVATRGVGGRRRWRRERGGCVNARWGRNLFTPPLLGGVKIGVGDRDE
jgi:hypothetical protein